jgi:hypothetical protein
MITIKKSLTTIRTQTKLLKCLTYQKKCPSRENVYKINRIPACKRIYSQSLFTDPRQNVGDRQAEYLQLPVFSQLLFAESFPIGLNFVILS